MTNEEKQIRAAQAEKEAERIGLGFCPRCEPSVYLHECGSGYICPTCGVKVEEV